MFIHTRQYTYTFDKWVPEIVAAVADATYTASYTSTTNEYTVTFDSVGGTQIASQTVPYGQKATKPADPSKPSADGHYYDFKFWTLNGQEYDFNSEVVANITLVAEYTVTDYSAPVIVIDGEKTLSIAAGESVTLPTVTAHDFRGQSLEVEFEDEFGGSTISNGVFTSKVAGDHVITYYTEDETGEPATDSVTVTVVPANAESFVVTSQENVPANITTFGTYKENFQKGTNAPYFKSLVDGNHAAYISGTSEAISGNSLVFNAKDIIGSQYALFGKVINDVILRETQVTYTISFDYKAINSDGCFNGLYFSPSYDTAGGAMGKDTKLSAQVGQVVHFEETYSRFVFPAEPTNCYLRIFNHNPSDTNVDSYVAIDNIVVTAKEETQISYVSPTTEQLLAEGGFTWNMSDKAAEISNTAFIAVNELEDATMKSAIQASEFFGENVVKVKGSSDHQMRSLNKNNVITGKVLEVTFWFYSVRDLGAIIFMGCNGGNTTVSGDNISTEVISGNIKKTTAKMNLASYSNVDVVNFYGTNPADEIYIGRITAKLYDYVPPQEVIDKPEAYIPTTAEIEAGYTWDMNTKFIDFDNSEYVDVANMEDATAKAAIQGNSTFGANVLRFKGGKMLLGVGKNNLTAGNIFTLDIDYYNISDAFSYFIVFGDGNSNYTQPSSAYSREVVSGNFKHFHFSVQLTAEMLQLDTILTTYSGTTEMLIGKVTVKCEEPEETFTDYAPTAAELEAGFTWEIGSANKHMGFSACNEVTKVSKISDSTIKGELSATGATYVDHVTLGEGANAIITGLSSSNVANGKEFTIVLEYYEVTAVQYFLLGGSGVAVQKESISGHLKRVTYNYKPTASFNYFSLYNTGEVYLYSAYAKVAAYEAPQDQTPSGHTIGEQISVYQSGDAWVSTNKNGYVVSNYDNGIENLSSLEGMGTAPKRIDITNPSGLVEISQGHSTQIEVGVKYKIVVCFYNVDYDGNMYIYGDNNQFWQVPGFESYTGYHKYEYEITPTATCNWLCLYSSTNTKSGTVYLGDIYVEVLALAS